MSRHRVRHARRHDTALSLVAPPLLLVAIVWLTSAIFFVGYQGMDDLRYVEAAQGWLRDAPFMGENHWHNRLPHVLSIAASFRLLGVGEVALVLPNVLVHTAFVLFLWAWLRRAVDAGTALFSGVLVATLPLFLTYQTIAYPLIYETALVCCAYLTMVHAVLLAPRPRASLVLLAAVLLGIAFLNRQTSAAGAIALALLALTTLRHWRAWFLFGAGFVVTVGVEFAWYFSRTGNPLHRFHVDTEGHRTPSAQLEGGTFEGSPFFNTELMSRWKPAGIVDIHWAVNPYIDLLTSPSYGPLALLSLPGAWLMLSRRGGASGRDRLIGRALLALAVLWFVTTVYVLSLRAQPRYFGPLAVVMVVFAAYALARLLTSGRRAIALFLCVAIVLANLALTGLRARPLQPERALAALAGSVGEPLWAPPWLLEKSAFLLELEPDLAPVRAGPAPAGGLEVRVERGVQPRPVSPTASLLARLPLPGHLRSQLLDDGLALSLWRDGGEVTPP